MKVRYCQVIEEPSFLINDSPGVFRRVFSSTSKFRGRQLLRRVRVEGLENTRVDGLILLADGMKAVDIVHDLYATVEKVKAENEEKCFAMDAGVSQLQTRQDQEGVIACVTIFLAGGQKCKEPSRFISSSNPRRRSGQAARRLLDSYFKAHANMTPKESLEEIEGTWKICCGAFKKHCPPHILVPHGDEN